jgi:DnaJ-class molecular chaperone
LKDHYAALGVSSAATLADIKKAFRQQAALHHPDRSAAAGAAARFRAVQEAYEILSDETRRAAYDANRKRNLLDDPLQTAGEIWASYFHRLLPERDTQSPARTP